MPEAKEASLQGSSWFVPPPRPRQHARRGRPPRPRHDATSLRAIIASSAFLVLFSASLILGGHAAIDPLLRSAMAARETRDVGDVVLPMADGKFCRHMSFDNATAEIVEGAIGLCPENIARGEFRAYRSFSWGNESDPAPGR